MPSKPSHHRASTSIHVSTARSLQRVHKPAATKLHSSNPVTASTLDWLDNSGMLREPPYQLSPSILRRRRGKAGKRPQVALVETQRYIGANADESTDLEDNTKNPSALRHPRALRRVSSALAEALQQQNEAIRTDIQPNDSMVPTGILDVTANEPATTTLDPLSRVDPQFQPPLFEYGSYSVGDPPSIQSEEPEDFLLSLVSLTLQQIESQNLNFTPPSIENEMPLVPPSQNATNSLFGSPPLDSSEQIQEIPVIEQPDSLMTKDPPTPLDGHAMSTDVSPSRSSFMMQDTPVSVTFDLTGVAEDLPSPTNHLWNPSDHLPRPTSFPNSNASSQGNNFSMGSTFSNEQQHLHLNTWYETAQNQDCHVDCLDMSIDTRDAMDIDNDLITGGQHSAAEDYLMSDPPSVSNTMGGDHHSSLFSPQARCPTTTASPEYFSTAPTQPRSLASHTQSTIPLEHSRSLSTSVLGTVLKAGSAMPSFASSLTWKGQIPFPGPLPHSVMPISSPSLRNRQSHRNSISISSTPTLPLSGAIHLTATLPSTHHAPPSPQVPFKPAVAAPVQTAWWASFKSVKFDKESSVYTLPLLDVKRLGRASIQILPAPRLRLIY